MRILATPAREVRPGDHVAGLGEVEAVKINESRTFDMIHVDPEQPDDETEWVTIKGPNGKLRLPGGNIVGVVDESGPDEHAFYELVLDWWYEAMTEGASIGRSDLGYRLERYVITADGKQYDVANFSATEIANSVPDAKAHQNARSFLELHLPIDRMPGQIRTVIPGWPA